MKSSLIRFLLSVTVASGTLVAADTPAASLDGLMQYQSGGDILPIRHYEALVRKAVDDPATRRSLEADFARVLTGNSTFEAKRFVCQQVAVIGGEASVPALAGLLKNDEAAGIACAALAQNPSPKASEALRDALGTTRGRTQAQVALALGVRQDTKATVALDKLARGADMEVAEAAIIALGKVASPDAARTLATLRKEGPSTLRRSVAEASFLVADSLAAGGGRQAANAIFTEYLAPSQPDDLRRGALSGLLRLDDDGGRKRALATLAGTDSALKPVAIAAVSAMKGKEVSKLFAAELPKLEPVNQVWLIQALALRGDPPARKAIEEQIAAGDKSVRLAAIAELGKAGDATTVPVLARTLIGQPSTEELKAAEVAFSSLKGGAATDQALAAQLRNRMAGNKTPILAALVRRAHPQSLPVFLAEATSPDATTVKLAYQGMSPVAQPGDLPAVLKALDGLRAESVLEDAQASVGQILRRAETPARASAAVREALKTASDAAGRARFLPLLAFCPEAEGLALVAAAAQDSQPETRDLGLRTLADWPDPAAWVPLKERYAKAPSETERVLALRGLVRLLAEQNAKADAALIGRYQELLAGAKGDTDRKLILGALSGCHHPDALTLAVEQLGNSGARAEAELAVKKIAEAIKAEHPQAAEAALQKLK
jgi:HEAT repeat protein